jgi:hypothetical protein
VFTAEKQASDIQTEVQLVLYRNTSNMIWDSVQREPTTQVLLEKLERRASLDTLAALIAIVVEADQLGRKSLAMYAPAQHTLRD